MYVNGDNIVYYGVYDWTVLSHESNKLYTGVQNPLGVFMASDFITRNAVKQYVGFVGGAVSSFVTDLGVNRSRA